jgi:hypothetical protein
MCFEPVVVEIFRLFSKPFCHSSLNFFITCETIAFETFLESSKLPEAKPGLQGGCYWIVADVAALVSVGSGLTQTCRSIKFVAIPLRKSH